MMMAAKKRKKKTTKRTVSVEYRHEFRVEGSGSVWLKGLMFSRLDSAKAECAEAVAVYPRNPQRIVKVTREVVLEVKP